MPAPDGSEKNRIVRELMEGRHNQENFRALFDSCYPAVRAFFIRRGFPPEDARDMAQDVFVAVYKNITTLHEPEAFMSWLFSISRHIAARHIERAQPARAAAATAEIESNLASPEPSPLSAMLDREKTGLVRAAIEELPDRMRQCLRARVVDNLNYREIGERLGISENTVAVQVHRAVKTMRSRLKALFGDTAFEDL
jgi:RNA polymerase sigma-70 factor (ECF subfamily)